MSDNRDNIMPTPAPARPAVTSAHTLRAWIAAALVGAELAAETVESADWIGRAAEFDPRAGLNMESD